MIELRLLLMEHKKVEKAWESLRGGGLQKWVRVCEFGCMKFSTVWILQCLIQQQGVPIYRIQYENNCWHVNGKDSMIKIESWSW